MKSSTRSTLIAQFLLPFFLSLPFGRIDAFALSESNFPEVSSPQWVVPANNLPPEFNVNRSNNCVSIAVHEGRLYLAWRSAASHFASKYTQMFVMSSPDLGKTWQPEKTIAMGSDVREPFLISFQGKLFLTYFQGGSDPLAFKPQHMWRTVRSPSGEWGEPEIFGPAGEVPWELKVRNNQIYMTSYLGNHYSAGASTIDLHFSRSTDGIHWEPVNPNTPIVYQGGVSEVGFEFTDDGTLWGVTRNEDGDKTGWGSHVVSSGNWGADAWQFPAVSDRNRYDSPRMFKHGSELYLIARRDIGGPFDRGLRKLPFSLQKWIYLTTYSLRAKRTALYHLNQQTRKVEWIQDFPSAGDTSFPSIVQTGPDDYLVANYTSPIWKARWNWLQGQTSKWGTQIYFLNLHFKPGT